jgi:deoxycytidine triphosphate deaminase
MHPEIEQLVHDQAIQSRGYKGRLKDGYAMTMKTYTGVIDKSRKQSASKINFIDSTANVIQSAKAVTRECVIRGWSKMVDGE